MEVTACIAETREEAEAFAKGEGIPFVYEALEDLLASPHKPSLLVVAAPNDVHPVATSAALNAGVPVFCEKPLANTADAALELANLAERTGVPATVGYSFRYSPAIQAMRKDLESGSLGEPWVIELFEYNSQFHPREGRPMNWKGDPAHAAAGALFEYGSHAIDLAGWLAGPIARVSTNLARVLVGARLDDIATLQLDFEGPAVGVIVASWVLSGSIPGIRVRLHGSEGLGEAELAETLLNGEAYRRIRLDGSIREEVSLEGTGGSIAAYAARHLRDFVAIVRGERQRYTGTMPTLGDGARVQVALDAALQATECWAAVARSSEQSTEETGARIHEERGIHD